MAEHVIKLPDVGEGVAEAELVEWHVKVGDLVREDTVLAAVMTDKATVEIPSPVDGEIVWLGAEIGDMVAVGSPLVRLKVAGGGNVEEASAAEPAPDDRRAASRAFPRSAPAADEHAAPPPPRRLRPSRQRALSRRAACRAPATSRWPRRPSGCGRARPASICARFPAAARPAASRHDDLDAFLAAGPGRAAARLRQRDDAVEEIKVVGLRRRIAEKMALAKRRIPHITYVEEVDVTALEELRAALNKDRRAERPRLTLLPFLMRAMVKAIAEQPAAQCALSTTRPASSTAMAASISASLRRRPPA